MKVRSLFAVLVFAVFVSHSVYAAPTCSRTYSSCQSGYYLSGGQCYGCNSGCTCAGGTAGQVCCSTSKSCSSWSSEYNQGTYNECTGNQSSACYKSCTKTCSGNATSSCPANATCSYNTSSYTTGTQYYGGSCSAAASSCPVSNFTCNTGYSKNSAGTACVPNIYKVTLDNQGATSAGTTAYYYQYNTASPCYYYTSSNLSTCLGSNGYTITKPTRTGYTFGGYYTGKNGTGTQYVDANGGGVNNLYGAVAGNTTLYAKWTANCNAITLDTRWGSCGSGSVSKLYKKTDATGWYSDSSCSTAYTTTTNVNPTSCPSSYVFRGYYSSGLSDVTSDASNGTQYLQTNGASTTAGTNWTVNGPATIYGAWAKSCTSPSNGSCSLSVSTSGVVDYTTSCNTGYTISNSNTATPSCTANTITIKYSANASGASGSTSDTSCTYDGSCSARSNGFTNGTKKFTGWNTAANGSGTGYAAGASIKNIISSGSITLYAQWTDCTVCATSHASCTLTAPAGVCTYATSCSTGYHGGTANTYNHTCTANTYTVKYNANGGTGTTSGSSHTYDVSKALTANGFTNGTKKFLGWSTSNTATSAAYTNGQSVSNLTTTDGGTVTLYAIWGSCTACVAGTGANCTLSAPLGVCTYATSCKAGYYSISNNGAYNPSCTAVTQGYYSPNGDNNRYDCTTQVGAAYTDSDGSRASANDCYKSCTKTCSGNATSSCPSNATCSYNTGSYTSGYEHYQGSCSAAASSCPVSSFSCNANYYANGTSCPACPTNLKSRAGAESVNDCGRLLHIGDETLLLHTSKVTTPSLNVQLGDDVFYGNMVPGDITIRPDSQRKLKTIWNNTVYSIYEK